VKVGGVRAVLTEAMMVRMLVAGCGFCFSQVRMAWVPEGSLPWRRVMDVDGCGTFELL